MMIRKTLLFAGLLTLLFGTQAYAQDAPGVDELVDRNVEAKGGRELLGSVQSMKQTGQAAVMGMSVPITIYAKRPDKVRSEVEVQGMEIVNAFDGETAWGINPMAGAEPQKLPADQVASIKSQASFDGMLFNHGENGYTLAYLGEGEVRGAPAYKLRVTDAAGDSLTLFLDADSFLEVKTEKEVTDPQMGQVTVETFFDDYRVVEGMKLPFVIETVVKGQSFQKVTMEEIDLNAEIPDSLFAFPGN